MFLGDSIPETNGAFLVSMVVSRLTRELWRDTCGCHLKLRRRLKTNPAESTTTADTGYLYIEDDDPDNELWLKLSRPLKHMTSFEMKNWEDES